MSSPFLRTPRASADNKVAASELLFSEQPLPGFEEEQEEQEEQVGFLLLIQW